MFFSAEAIRKIEAGQKTATTRVSGRYKVGQVLAIQLGRGKKGIGWIKITDIGIIVVGFGYTSEGLTFDTPCGKLAQHSRDWYIEEGFESPNALYQRFLNLKLDKTLARNGVLYFYRFVYVGKEKP